MRMVGDFGMIKRLQIGYIIPQGVASVVEIDDMATMRVQKGQISWQGIDQRSRGARNHPGVPNTSADCRRRSSSMFSLFTDLGRAAQRTILPIALDYQVVVDRVRAHAESARRLTVEALAADIARIGLEEPGVERVVVRVEKPGACLPAVLLASRSNGHGTNEGRVQEKTGRQPAESNGFIEPASRHDRLNDRGASAGEHQAAAPFGVLDARRASGMPWFGIQY